MTDNVSEAICAARQQVITGALTHLTEAVACLTSEVRQMRLILIGNGSPGLVSRMEAIEGAAGLLRTTTFQIVVRLLPWFAMAVVGALAYMAGGGS